MEGQVRKSEKFWSWSGSPEDLRRLAAMMQDAIGRFAATLPVPPADLEGLDFDERMTAARLVLGGNRVPTVTAETADHALTYTGTIDEVLPEIDHRKLIELKVSCSVAQGHETAEYVN